MTHLIGPSRRFQKVAEPSTLKPIYFIVVASLIQCLVDLYGQRLAWQEADSRGAQQ